MATERKTIRFITKRGTAIHPHTNVPVTYSESAKRSIPDPDGKFDITIALTPEKAAPIQKDCKQAWADAKLSKQPPKNWPWKPEIDKETEEETGRLLLTFKAYGKDRDGNPRRLPHFNTDGVPYESDFRLNSGATVRIAGRPNPYKGLGGGVSLNVDAIYVISNPEFVSNPFADMEDDEEDGDASGAEQGTQDEAADDTDF